MEGGQIQFFGLPAGGRVFFGLRQGGGFYFDAEKYKPPSQAINSEASLRVNTFICMGLTLESLVNMFKSFLCLSVN